MYSFLDEFDPASGILVRTCEEDVAVNKCEGECASSIYPSAKNTYGFHKVNLSFPQVSSSQNKVPRISKRSLYC